MLFAVGYAIEFTCNNTWIPAQCQGELYQNCQFDKIRGSTLKEISDNVGKLCEVECGYQLQRLDRCLIAVGNMTDVATVCRDMWNVRCARYNGDLCYQQRLQNWINQGYVNGDDVNNAIKQDKNPGMPCTNCTRTMVGYEKEYDRFMATKQPDFFSWSLANADTARKSCGNDFFGNFTVDPTIFNGVGQIKSHSTEDLNWGLISGLAVASIVLLIIAIVGCIKYRKGKRQFFNPVRRNDSTMTGSTRLSEPILNSKLEDNYKPPKYSSSELASSVSQEMDQYYVSRPS